MLYREWDPITGCIQRLGPSSLGLLLTIGYVMLVKKSLGEVARSMCEARDIRDGDILVGASLGGMIACEIMKIRAIPTLYLIGSATCKDEVSRVLAALHPLAQAAPIDWLRLSAASIPLELAQMFTGIEASFIRAMCLAIFDWDGLGATNSRLVRVHGRHDLVIPPPERVDLLLDGGHLISISHASVRLTSAGTSWAGSAERRLAGEPRNVQVPPAGLTSVKRP